MRSRMTLLKKITIPRRTSNGIFPSIWDIEGENLCVIAGGGKVAYRRYVTCFLFVCVSEFALDFNAELEALCKDTFPALRAVCS